MEETWTDASWSSAIFVGASRELPSSREPERCQSGSSRYDWNPVATAVEGDNRDAFLSWLDVMLCLSPDGINEKAVSEVVSLVFIDRAQSDEWR